MATQIGSGTGTLATYIPDLTDTADITVALKQLYYGTTAGTLSQTTGIYGALYTLFTGNPTLAGNVTISGTLTVNGGTTNINSTNLVVEDKNITLADVTTPTTTTADGAGLTVLNGATNPTWLWNWNNVTNGTSAWTSNYAINAPALYIGTGTFPNYQPGASLLSFASASIIGRGANASYAQIAMVNTNSTGSADFAAYGDNGDDASGWADMGFTGSTFSDSNYTITGQNDGYLFVSARSGASKPGNLVLATSGNGTSNAIIFGTGGFLTANERARITSTGLSMTSSTIKLRAGSTAADTAPMYFTTSSSTLTAPAYGAVEATADAAFLTMNPGTTSTGPGRGFISAPQMVFSLATSTTSTNTTQSVFAAANDVLSVLEPAKLYRFRAKYYSNFTYTATAGAINVIFAFSNAPTAIKYSYKTYPQSSGTSITQMGSYSIATAASIVPSQTSSGSWVTEIDGYFTTHATLTSTLTPQFICTAASSSTGSIGAGSWIEIEKLGTSTQTLIAGNWA